MMGGVANVGGASVTGADVEGVAMPVLPGRDLDKLIGFYGRIGFSIEWEDETYVILVRKGIELHFAHVPDLDPMASNSAVYVRARDVRALYEELLSVVHPAVPPVLTNALADEFRVRAARGGSVERLHTIEEKPWGGIEFAIVDPSGNLVRFGMRS